MDTKPSGGISQPACAEQVTSIIMDPPPLGKILIEVRVLPTSFDAQECSYPVPHRVLVSAPSYSNRSEDRRVCSQHGASWHDCNIPSDKGSALFA